MLFKFLSLFLLYTQVAYCLSIGKLLSNALASSSKGPIPLAAGEAALQKINIAKPVPSEISSFVANIFPSDISELHGYSTLKLSPSGENIEKK